MNFTSHLRLSIVALFCAKFLGISVLVYGQGDRLEQEVDDTEVEETTFELEGLTITGESAPRHESIGRPETHLHEKELERKVQGTIGETLAHELGVHNTSYGPGVGLPVLRGLSGVRVNISEDGLKTWDASVLSPDHASTIEPSQAQSIRVIRGPSTVLYGNGAIGGAVLVESSRIAKYEPEKKRLTKLKLDRELYNDSERFSSVISNQFSANSWVFYIDGVYKHNKSVSIPGNDLDIPAIVEQFGFLEGDLVASEGFIPNSDTENKSYSTGLSQYHDNGYWGVSYRSMSNNYGIPSGLHVHPEGDVHIHSDSGEELEAIRIDLQQERFQTQGSWFFTEHSWLSEFEWNIGYLDYHHREFEESAVGTNFDNDVLELKATLFHEIFYGFDGQLGLQFFDRKFSAIGDENFVPNTKQKMLGLFLAETYNHTYGEFQFGGRIERQVTDQLEATSAFGTNGASFILDDINHTTATIAFGASLSLSEAHNFEFNISQSSRAPDIQELYALGPHLATYSYDLGHSIRNNEPLDPEVFLSIDLGWHWRNRLGHQNIYLFHIDAKDYIYQQRLPFFYDFKNTGANFFRASCAQAYGCLPVYEYQQRDAEFYGYEWQWSISEWYIGTNILHLTLSGDEVRAKFKNGEDIPRIPPRRWALDLGVESKNWLTSVRIDEVADQNRAGNLETVTDGYLKVGLTVDYSVAKTSCIACVVRLKIRNLFDEEIRNSTSFLRNLAPEPGREISLGIGLQF